MPVLERPREEDVEPLGQLLELGAVVAEADDDRARIDPAQRLEQHLDALVPDQLAEVDDGRPVAGEERREPLGVALVRVAARSRCPGSAGPRAPRRPAPPAPPPGPAAARARRRRRAGSCARARPCPQISASTSRMCSEPTITAAAPLERLAAPARQLLVPAHRVLELGAVRLDDVARAAARADRARRGGRG